MENRYEVSFVSKDNQTFTYTCSATCEMEAINTTEEKIRDNGWDAYRYTFDKIRTI